MNIKRRILVMGPVYSGKTTLCRCLAGLPVIYNKTHSIEIIGGSIDTPGEFLENRALWHRIKVSAVDAGLILFLQDASNLNFHFAPGQVSMFACPVAGIATKTDIANEKQISQALDLLALAGASPRFAVSLITGAGMEDLKKFLGKYTG
ncbi:MAG: EutP/PduV family microcompartment system protein [Spirochaetaceae bacterium]|jgi:ethanolamine utilization protein EutP|nr:EutP/PduV family microcompartment system protein [Spirochaetaceae bacterium]